MVSEGAESGRESISEEEEEEEEVVVGKGERRAGSSEREEKGSEGEDILGGRDGMGRDGV